MSGSVREEWRSPERLGVFVIAAYPSVRAGLRAMAEQSPDVVVLADAPDDDLDTALVPDLLLVDVDPERATIPARLAERYPDTPLVLLLDGPAAWRRLALPPDRPVAALLKDATAGEIGAALHAAAQGLVVFAPEVARQSGPLAATHPRLDDDPSEPLTERERQVLELLALGLPNKTIALELGISEHTAKFHVAAIMSKLGAASRTEAVALAARRGVLVL